MSCKITNRYVIVNAKKSPAVIDVTDASVYKTERAGQAIELIRDVCTKDPHAEIHIYGGDGSVFEAVNALLSAGCTKSATLVIHPFGTGNDFVRNFSQDDADQTHLVDLIRFGDMYAANEINVGFDCDVVALTQKIKKTPFIKGSAAYMIGVLLTLLKPMGKTIHLTYVDEYGNTETIQKKLLLCLIANGGYYGGGFHCAPRASLDDGLLELICVDKISRLKFLSFFLGYRKGKHLLEDGTLQRKYASFLHYKRIRSATFQNVGNVCADGEIFNFGTLTVSVEPQAIRLQVRPKTN